MSNLYFNILIPYPHPSTKNREQYVVSTTIYQSMVALAQHKKQQRDYEACATREVATAGLSGSRRLAGKRSGPSGVGCLPIV